MQEHFGNFVGRVRFLDPPMSDPEILSALMRHFPQVTQSLWIVKEEKTVTSAYEFLRAQDQLLQEAAAANPPRPARRQNLPGNDRPGVPRA